MGYVMLLLPIRVCARVNGTLAGCFSADEQSSVYVPIAEVGQAWLTAHLMDADDVEGRGTITASSAPIPVVVTALEPAPVRPVQKLTAVLTLVLDDLDRAAVLLYSLERALSARGEGFANGGQNAVFEELIVVVPDAQAPVFEQLLLFHSEEGDCKTQRLPVRVVRERTLLPVQQRRHEDDTSSLVWEGYAVQMALKLLVSTVVRTEFYVTLDADVVCTKMNLTTSDFLSSENKATFVDESREVHSAWWASSEAVLGMAPQGTLGGFGVTPAVLSQCGAFLVLARLREVHGENAMEWLLTNWGQQQQPEQQQLWWSEYTLYRSALRHFRMFKHLHEPQHEVTLMGHNVWFAQDLPWRGEAALADETSLFSVVQSSTNVRASQVLQQFQTADAT